MNPAPGNAPTATPTWQMAPPSQSAGGYVYYQQSTLTELGILPKLVQALVGAVVAISTGRALLEYNLYSKFSAANSGMDVADSTWEFYDLSGLAILLHLLLMISAGVATGFLLERMLDNGRALRPADSTHKSHWAFTGWFVPFLNLVRPYQVVEQAWITSAPAAEDRTKGVPKLVQVWWVGFILLTVVDRVVPNAPWEGATIEDYANESLGLVFAALLTIPVGLAFIRVIGMLSKRHTAVLAAPPVTQHAPTAPMPGAMPPPPAFAGEPASPATATPGHLTPTAPVQDPFQR